MRPAALLTPQALAHCLPGAVSPDDLAKLARRGVLPAVPIGRRWRFRPRDVRTIAAILAAHERHARWPRRWAGGR